MKSSCMDNLSCSLNSYTLNEVADGEVYHTPLLGFASISAHHVRLLLGMPSSNIHADSCVMKQVLYIWLLVIFYISKAIAMIQGPRIIAGITNARIDTKKLATQSSFTRWRFFPGLVSVHSHFPDR